MHYSLESVPFAWEDASDGTLLLDGADDETAEWPEELAFSFPFYGKTYSSMRVSSNGVLFFEEPPLFSAETVDFPSFRLPHALAACYWTDLWATPGRGVFVKSTGTAPGRHFIVQWQEMSCWGTDQTGTFQAVLDESTGDIRFNYLDTIFGDPAFDFGLTALSGVEDQTGADGHPRPAGSPASPALDCQSSLRLRPAASPARPAYLQSDWKDVVPGALEGTLRVYLVNAGIQDSNDISAVLESTTPDIIILENAADYGCLPPGDSAGREFRIRFPVGFSCDGEADFSLNLSFTDADGRPWNTAAAFEQQPAAGLPVAPLLHDAESASGWECGHGQGTEDWGLVQSPVHSPSSAWHVEGEDGVQDAWLLSPWIVVPDSATLEFYHLYDFEPGFDGGVVEVQTGDGLSPWRDLALDQTRGVYGGRIAEGYGNPLEGRAAWTGDSGGVYESVGIKLLRYAGEVARFRFRQGSDRHTASGGWWIDDVAVTGQKQSCPTVVSADMNEDQSLDVADLVVALGVFAGNIAAGQTGNLNQSPPPGNPPPAPPAYLNDLGDLIILANYFAGNLVFWY